MTNCNSISPSFSSIKTRKIEMNFEGGSITSDGGSLLLREADLFLDLTRKVSKSINDTRRQDSVEHSQLSMLQQRVYGLALGYEDINDHNSLRHDICFQTLVGQDTLLSSAPTLCRFENRATRDWSLKIHEIIIENFIASFDSPPEELILDFDATDDPVHGNQKKRFFHGYYGRYCFLPLYVFCKDQLLVSYLRPSNIDGAKHSWAILSFLVKRFREEWPRVCIIFRGDSGFCRHKMLNWCEKHNVYYIVGLPGNKRLAKESKELRADALALYEVKGEKQKLFQLISYGAKTWKKERNVIIKAEYNHLGANTRYVVTNLPGEADKLYEEVYCARGDMENRIKEQKLYLFAERTSCTEWYPNQFRLLLSSLAYILIETIRRLALANTELVHAQSDTIRLKLFKIGAIVLKNTRRIRFLLASSYPYKSVFYKAFYFFASG